MLVWKSGRDHWPGKTTDIQWVAVDRTFVVAYIRWQKFPDSGPAYSWWFDREAPDLHHAYTAEECKAQVEVAWRAWHKMPRFGLWKQWPT